MKEGCLMNRLLCTTVVLLLLLAGPARANLLANGDFNTTLGAEWGTWGDGWKNQEVITPAPGLVGVYDGTLQMTIGNSAGSGSQGMFQTVAGTAGLEYTLSLQAGAQDWWWPNGSAYLKFLDAGDSELASYEIDTTADFDNWDVGVPYQDFSIGAVAPVGTTQVKIDLIEWAGTGSVWFDNVSLEVVPEPGSLLLVGCTALCWLLRRGRG